MLYFIQSVEGGPIKIGTTKDLPNRVKQLEANYRTPMVILATMDGTYREERAMHRRFSHLRLGRTEQFRPEPDLMGFIGMPLFACAGDVVPLKDQSKKMVLGVRGSEEWKDWLGRLAEHCRLDMVDVVDLALVDYAAKIGFRSPPRR